MQVQCKARAHILEMFAWCNIYMGMQLTLALHINLSIIISKHLELQALPKFCEFPFPVYSCCAEQWHDPQMALF